MKRKDRDYYNIDDYERFEDVIVELYRVQKEMIVERDKKDDISNE